MNIIKMNGYVIRSLMRDAKVDVKAIAAQCEVSGPMVSQVIHNTRKTPRIRAAISAALNMPVADLWPDDQQSANAEEAA